jgi:hypothetical protein
MNQTATPAHIIADGPQRRAACTESDQTPALARVLAFMASVISRNDEDNIVKRYEGHAWCDSTERRLNYDIMIGRYTRL